MSTPPLPGQPSPENPDGTGASQAADPNANPATGAAAKVEAPRPEATPYPPAAAPYPPAVGPQPPSGGAYPPAGGYAPPGTPPYAPGTPPAAASFPQPGQPYPQPGEPGAQSPYAGQPYAAAQPAQKKSRKGLWIGLGVGALVLVLMLVGIASVLASRGGGLFGPSPSDRAKQHVSDYFTALSEGRAADALALVDDSSITDKTLLTDAVLADSLSRAPLTDIAVGDPVEDGSSSFTVPVTYSVGGESTSDSLNVYVSSSTGPSLYSATAELGLYLLDGAPVTVNGVELTSVAPEVFPGSYVVASSSEYLTVEGDSTIVALNSTDRPDPSLQLAVSEAGVQMFRDKVIPAAEACLASTALNPGCGQAVPAEVNGVQVRDNTVKRTMDAENRAKLANVTPEPGSSVPTIISAWDMGYFDVEAECNDGGSWGACTYTGEGTSFGTASIDVTDLELKVQWGS